MEWDLGSLARGIISDSMFLLLIFGAIKIWKLDFNKYAKSLPWIALIPIYIGLGIIRILLGVTIG